MNFNDFNSEQYRKAFDSLSAISKSIAPQIKALQNATVAMPGIWSNKINADAIKAITGYRGQITDFSVLSKQLESVFMSFGLSDETRAFIAEAKASENLSEDDFEEKYGEEIQVCKTLGLNGWVVSGHATPREIQEWYNAIGTDSNHKRVEDFFEKDDGRVIKNIIVDLEKIYTNPANKNYFVRGIKAFDEEDYMTCAMYLVALLDVRINKLANFPSSARHYSQKFSDAGFADIKQNQFDGADSFFTKRYYFLDVYPSLIAYLNRLFVDGEYKFKNEIEPPYINRNWILHGRCSRGIERYECIQVLNALDMIENILGCDCEEKQD